MLRSDNRIRYKAIDNPFGFKVRLSKPHIHPCVSKYEEFTENQKNNLQIIKQVVFEKIGECEIGVYGSQVKGNYDSESDYDVVVYKQTTRENMTYLRKYDYGFRVDMSFSSKIANNEQIVMI